MSLKFEPDQSCQVRHLFAAWPSSGSPSLIHLIDHPIAHEIYLGVVRETSSISDVVDEVLDDEWEFPPVRG